jgi:4-diphosphocytidyl-2C-methyl-D-erythritol kinase
MNKIRIKSPAKINLFLRVLEQNNNGYHSIETSFQYVDLYDFMSFEVTDEGIKIKSNESFLKMKIILFINRQNYYLISLIIKLV